MRDLNINTYKLLVRTRYACKSFKDKIKNDFKRSLHGGHFNRIGIILRYLNLEF